MGLEIFDNSPVVQVISQVAVAFAKLEGLEEGGILKDVQGVEDIVIPASNRNEG